MKWSGIYCVSASPDAADRWQIDAGIGLNADDVTQRDVEFAAEGPELVQTLNSERDPVAVNRDVDHGEEGNAPADRRAEPDDSRVLLRGARRSSLDARTLVSTSCCRSPRAALD